VLPTVSVANGVAKPLHPIAAKFLGIGAWWGDVYKHMRAWWSEFHKHAESGDMAKGFPLDSTSFAATCTLSIRIP